MSQKLPKELRVEALLNAAVEEFLTKGYSGTSVDAIAARAGVSKGGFYHHFPNKEVLLMETNRKMSEPVERMAETAYCYDSALEGLRYYIRAYLSYWITRPREMSFLFLSMSKSFESELLMAYYKEYIKGAADFFTGMFRRAAENGELNITDPDSCGISMMGALDGVLSYLIVHPEEDVGTFAARLEKIWFTQNGGIK